MWTRLHQGSIRWDVLVQAEEVVRVILPLQGLQPIVFLSSVSLANSLLSLLHEEVHVDALMVRPECRPQASGPFTFLVEALTRRGRGVDVNGVPRASTTERRLVLPDAPDGASEMKDREGGQGRLHAYRMVDGGVNDSVRELRHVAGTEVVPPTAREGRVEHGLVVHERFRRAYIEHRRTEFPYRAKDFLSVLDRTRVAAGDDDYWLAVQLRRHNRERRGLPMNNDRCQLVGHLGDPLAVETQHLRGFLHRPEDGAGECRGAQWIEAKLEFGDDAEVATPAAHSPEQICILVLASSHELAVGSDHVYREELINRQPELSHQPSDATPEREPGESGMGNYPGRNGEPEGLCLSIQLAKQYTRLRPRRARLGVDADALHKAEVDDHAPVAHRLTWKAVTSAADRYRHLGLSRKSHGRDDVRNTGAARDQSRSPTDRPVPDLAVFIVGGVTGSHELAPERRLELVHEGGVQTKFGSGEVHEAVPSMPRVRVSLASAAAGRAVPQTARFP